MDAHLKAVLAAAECPRRQLRRRRVDPCPRFVVWKRFGGTEEDECEIRGLSWLRC